MERVNGLLIGALSGDVSARLAFASAIPTIVAEMSQETQLRCFVSFLATWLPRDDQQIVSAVVNALPEIVVALGSVTDCAWLVEALVCSDDTGTTERVAHAFLQTTEPSPLQLALALSGSKYDCVRRFPARLLAMVQSEADKGSLLKCLVEDKSFSVRFAAAELIPNLSDELALSVATVLVIDKSSRIRAFLTVVCSSRMFYLIHTATVLAGDRAWAVRVAVATGLVKCVDVDGAFCVAVKLAEDPVWQVRLASLRSMTTIITGSSNLDTARVRVILEENLRSPAVGIKTAVVDVLMAMTEMIVDPNDVWSRNFAAEVMNDSPSTVKLHFLGRMTNIDSAKIMSNLGPVLPAVMDELQESSLWRLRVGVIDVLRHFASVKGDHPAKERLAAYCGRHLDDEAQPVRLAAANGVADLIGRAPLCGTLPQYLQDIAHADTYRKRQAAATIMGGVYKVTDNAADKEVLMSGLRDLMNDPCSNVVATAQTTIDSLE